MKAVILAAGKGTRMGEITRTVPKPLVPVNGRAELEIVIRGLRDHGFKDFIIVTGYLGDKVRAHFGDGSGLGVNITYVHQEVQEGTARALLLTRAIVGSSDLLLTFTDIITTPANYGRAWQYFYDHDCDVLGGIRCVDDPFKGAAVYLDEQNNILKIIEKPARGTSTTHWNHAGLYCFKPAIFDYLELIGPSARGEYDIADAVTRMIRDRRIVKAIEMTEYWKDLATPEDVKEAEEALATW